MVASYQHRYLIKSYFEKCFDSYKIDFKCVLWKESAVGKKKKKVLMTLFS